MKLIHPLLCLLLERFRRGRKVGVLVSEQLVGYLAREQHAHIALLVDGLAAKVHADACTDGGYIVSAQKPDDILERGEHLLFGHADLGVVSADKLGSLAGILKIDRVKIHADGKGLYLLTQKLCGNCAHKARVKAAREQKSDRRIGAQAL